MRKAWQLLPIYMIVGQCWRMIFRKRECGWEEHGGDRGGGNLQWVAGAQVFGERCFSLNDFHPVIRFIPFVGTAVCAAPWKTTALLRLKISWKEEARNVQLFQIPNKFLWFQASLTTSCWRQQGWLILLPLLPCSGLTKSWALRCGKHLFLVTFPRPINNHYWQRVGRSGVESIIVMSPCLQRFTWMVWSLWSTPRTV